MKHNITILALSRKWGGRCVAGYDHDDGRVVRLVCDNLGRELETSFTAGIKLLDTVEVEIVRSCSYEHQTENVLIDPNFCLKVTGNSNEIEDFDDLACEDENIFGDNQYKLNNVLNLGHSFELIKFRNMSIYVEDGKTKADFYVGRTLHKWYRITDIIHEGRSAQIKSGYAVITIPPSDDFTERSGYYKYIAAIYPADV